MVDFWGEGVPNWIMAVTSSLTLVAAGIAAFFAGKAAHWTKEQSEASDRQADLAQDQLTVAADALEVAKSDSGIATTLAEEQRRDSRRNQWALERARLDALAPTVWIVASPIFHASGPDTRGGLPLMMREYDPSSYTYGEPKPVVEDLEIVEGHNVMFQLSIELSFRNISDKVARIDVVDLVQGELDAPQDEPFIVPPNDARKVTWTRKWLSTGLNSEEAVHDPMNWWFTLTLRSGDLGLNVRDTYKFHGDLRFFARDGSRLLVRPRQAFPWAEKSAEPVGDRSYERLPEEAQNHGIDQPAPSGPGQLHPS